MKRLTECITWWAVVAAILLAADAPCVWAGRDLGISESSTYTEVAARIDEWVLGSLHYSLDLLGIAEMEYSGTYIHNENERRWMFETEPEITRIDRYGPAEGRLKHSDVIVAVDGMLITTRKAGVRFANLIAAEPVQLTVRRGRRERTVTIVPQELPEPDIPLEFRARYSERENTLTVTPGRVLIPELARTIETIKIRETALTERMDSMGVLASPQYADRAPHGWFGFGLSFAGSIRRNDAGERADWIFFEPPSIKSIQQNSPADQAGLQVDDVLLEIDGLKLDSKSGGRRFSLMEPGQTIEWKVKRDRETFTVETVAAERPPQREPVEPEFGSLSFDTLQPIRFTGDLGATEIEVRGSHDVQVIADEETGGLIIRAGDATVRLKSKNQR